MFLVLLVSIGMLLLICFMFDRGIMSPRIIFCISFFMSALFCVILQDDYQINLHIETYFFILFAMVSFIVGTMFIKPFGRIKNKKIIYKEFFITSKIIYPYIVLALFSLVTTYQMYSEVIHLVLGGSSISFIDSINNVRGFTLNMMSQTDERVLPVWLRLLNNFNVSISYVCFYGFLYNHIFYHFKKYDLLYLFPMITAVLYYSFIGSRTFVFSYIYFGVAIYFYLKVCKENYYVANKILCRKMITIIFVSLIFVYALGTIRSTEDFSILSGIFTHKGGPLAALDYYIMGAVDLDKFPGWPSSNTLVGIYDTLEMLGAHVPHIYAPAEPIWFPNGVMTNVYTGFMRYHLDFGYIGMMLILIGQGMLFEYGHQYIITNRNVGFAMILYAMFYKAIFVLSAEDNVLMGFSGQTIFNITSVYILWRIIMRPRSDI